MDLWIVIVLYVAGLSMIVAESMMPGVIMGLIGTAAMVTSIVFGFQHHWALGTGQIVLAVVATPLAFYVGMKRMQLKASLEGNVSFAQDYSSLLGREGETHTELRPAGIVFLDGKKVDVVTSGEMIDRGRRVRVVKVEGNRIVVKGI